MRQKISNEETLDMDMYEPLDSEFRERARMDWRVEEKGIRMYGLRWKYVLLSMEDDAP
jgi:hypothetical protein